MEIQDLIDIYEAEKKGIVLAVGYHLHPMLRIIGECLGGQEEAATFFRTVQKADKPKVWEGGDHA